MNQTRARQVILASGAAMLIAGTAVGFDLGGELPLIDAVTTKRHGEPGHIDMGAVLFAVGAAVLLPFLMYGRGAGPRE